MNWLKKIFGQKSGDHLEQPAISNESARGTVEQVSKKSIKQLEAERDSKGLIEYLKDENSSDVGYAAQALGRLKEKQATGSLITLLKHHDSVTRHKAIHALADIGDASAVEPLIAMLEADDLGDKIEATEALGRLRDARAVNAISKQLPNTHFNLSRATTDALQAIGDKKAVEPLINLLKTVDRKEINLRSRAVIVLGTLRDPHAIEPLVEEIKNGNWSAVDALLQIGPLAIDALTKIELAPETAPGQALIIREKVDGLISQLKKISANNPDPTTNITQLSPGTSRKDIDGIDQVYVPAGIFIMGRDIDPFGRIFEKFAHEVHITRPFWLDRFLVTNAAYAEFIKDGGYKTSSLWTSEGWAWRTKENRTGPDDWKNSTESNLPRVGVSVYEAEAYAKWRGGRLPTDAEWEYAARGPKSFLYPWGDEYQEGYANIGNSSLKRISPVDAYPKGKCWVGAYDMAGNVWEWTADIYDEKFFKSRPTPDIDPLCTHSTSIRMHRVMRGGSYLDFTRGARTAERGYILSMTHGHSCVGLRIVTPIV